LPGLNRSEVLGGIVVQLDTDELRCRCRSQTNAEISDSHDRAVEGPHSFLILEVNTASEEVLAVPVFSREAPGSEPLLEKHKSGYSPKWKGVPLWYSKWQHWRIPLGDLVAASSIEETAPGNRRLYAHDSPSELAAMAAWVAKNRSRFRSVSSG
jgi:hypothetical protein